LEFVVFPQTKFLKEGRIMKARRFQGLATVALSMAVLGCGGNAADHGHGHEQDARPSATDPHDHDHLAEGPHGGHLIELGHNEVTAELVFNDERHEVVVHLAAAPGMPSPEGQPVVGLQLFEDGEFVDYPLSPGEADGAAVFTLVDEKVHRILDAGHVKGRLRVTWGDKEYSAPLDDICHGH
jgi:hypothetical protein